MQLCHMFNKFVNVIFGNLFLWRLWYKRYFFSKLTKKIPKMFQFNYKIGLLNLTRIANSNGKTNVYLRTLKLLVSTLLPKTRLTMIDFFLCLSLSLHRKTTAVLKTKHMAWSSRPFLILPWISQTTFDVNAPKKLDRFNKEENQNPFVKQSSFLEHHRNAEIDTRKSEIFSHSTPP